MGLIVHGGKLLFVDGKIATSTDCCCDPCNACSGLPDEWVVDLGASPFTNSHCSDCTSIGGEYTLSRLTSFLPSGVYCAAWRYQVEMPCSSDVSGLYFKLYVYLEFDSANSRYRYSLRISTGELTPRGCQDAPPAQPSYASDWFTSGNACETGPMTFTPSSTNLYYGCLYWMYSCLISGTAEDITLEAI